MSTLEAEAHVDSPTGGSPTGGSPTHSDRAEPPPVPTKWKSHNRVEENQLSDAQAFRCIPCNDDTQNAKQEVLKSTPQRPRLNRPLSPLSPTALNCLPSGLFSPGSLPMPKHFLAEASW